MLVTRPQGIVTGAAAVCTGAEEMADDGLDFDMHQFVPQLIVNLLPVLRMAEDNDNAGCIIELSCASYLAVRVLVAIPVDASCDAEMMSGRR